MLFLGNELGNESDCLGNQIGNKVGNEAAAILTLPGFASQSYYEVFIMAVNDKQSEQDWIARIKAGQKLTPYAESFTSPRLRVAWVECPKHLLDFVEIYLIGFFQPPLNIKHKG